jgi:hypothetical protein
MDMAMEMEMQIKEMEMATTTTMGGGISQLVKMEKLSTRITKTRSHLGEAIPLITPTIRSMAKEIKIRKLMVLEAQIREIMLTKTGTITW